MLMQEILSPGATMFTWQPKLHRWEEGFDDNDDFV